MQAAQAFAPQSLFGSHGSTLVLVSLLRIAVDKTLQRLFPVFTLAVVHLLIGNQTVQSCGNG